MNNKLKKKQFVYLFRVWEIFLYKWSFLVCMVVKIVFVNFFFIDKEIDEKVNNFF